MKILIITIALFGLISPQEPAEKIVSTCSIVDGVKEKVARPDEAVTTLKCTAEESREVFYYVIPHDEYLFTGCETSTLKRIQKDGIFSWRADSLTCHTWRVPDCLRDEIGGYDRIPIQNIGKPRCKVRQ